jgi:hypothetical protein
MNAAELREAYVALRGEADRLAGGLTDLGQRAAVYHHLYHDSGGNHIFPLIAAHGALWARGYFRFGMRLGRCFAWQYCLNLARHHTQLAALADFADAFRDINRRVCADVYTNYHFVLTHGDEAGADRLMPARIFEAVRRLVWAKRHGRALSDAERLEVFEAHFLNEQETEVGPSVARAGAALDWPVMKWLALQPIVRFAYFPRGRLLRFRNFASVDERIRNGLQAFAWGSEVGWQTVEEKLGTYKILPADLFRLGPEYFARLRFELVGTS